MSSNKADQSPEPESRPRVLVLGGGLVGKFGGSITVIGPDFKPVAFSTIQSSSFKWPLGLAIDSKNNAWSPATSAAVKGHRDFPVGGQLLLAGGQVMSVLEAS
jgi:hypothetical protein